jgi:uncharacterized membrane protein HdeD (DUF308 family)
VTEQQSAGTAHTPAPDVHVSPTWENAVGAAGRHWGLHLFNGAVMVLVGIAALVWPGESLFVISLLFAITLLMNGAVQIMRSIADTDAGGGQRVLFGLLGALSLLVGVLCLRSPLHTLAAIALLIGSWWIVSGVLSLVGAVGRSTAGSRAWAAVFGVLSVLGGFVVLLPGISLAVLELTLGLTLIVLGIVMSIDALRSRRG